MSESVIVAKGVSKRYRIGIKEEKSVTLAGRIFDLMRTPFRNFRNLSNLSNFGEDDQSVFWALKDVNFEIKRGEVQGIIGHNGAGKSTLLKILSRITDPTSGEVQIKGRISSLLEVGTGFHPELTGRENIYMNGTILGMRKYEIDSKIDEIISFSGVSRHVDTPVKFYSSGMKVRLGFSVAAHLEPEILVIDEVLSVGDLEFQRKCLGKMEAVAGSGRTVLFVSHSMASIKQLCTGCMVMNTGRITFQGDVNEAIQQYVAQNTNSTLSTSYRKLVLEKNAIEVLEAHILDQSNEPRSDFNADESVFIRLKCRKNENVPGIQGYFVIRSESDEVYIESDTYDFLPNVLDALTVGDHELELMIPPRVLPKGRFKVYLNFTSSFSSNGYTLDSPKDILTFQVYDTTTKRASKRKAYTNIIVEWKRA
jgi:lipopolysaccharide transport system ATP-binding protein